MAEKSRGAGRTRSWTFILYPESAPENWRDLLDEYHVPWVESPLHDRDINATGEPKKAHWHILVMFESVKTFEQVKEITDTLNAPIPQKCAGAQALVRYMAHLDNPDKAQYNKLDIIGHGGVDVADMLRPSSSERYDTIAEMVDYIDEHNYVEFWDFFRYCRHERRDTWFPLLCDNCSFVIKEAIKSRRFALMHPTVNVNEETGEVIE